MEEQNNRKQLTRERLNGCFKKDKESKIIGLCEKRVKSNKDVK